jgi:preprotein translocase subunit SecB
MADDDNMADSPGPNGNGNGADHIEMDEMQLAVKAQYVKDLSFENPSAPAGLMEVHEEPEIDVNVNVEVGKLNDEDYEVALTIGVDAKAADTQLFICELSYAGVFGIGPTIPEEHHPPILLIECARLLFPFARAIIADATREGGFQPLLLQPLDFAALYEQQMQQAS